MNSKQEQEQGIHLFEPRINFFSVFENIQINLNNRIIKEIKKKKTKKGNEIVHDSSVLFDLLEL